MRKACRRRVWAPLPPRGLRPRLAPDQVTDLALAHMTNLDLIARGLASEAELWQMVGGVMTWSRAADMLQAGVPEMRAQLELAARLVERYGATGEIRFNGVEYEAAKLGVQVMDELAAIVDANTAVAAAHWGEAQVNRLQARCARREGTTA